MPVLLSSTPFPRTQIYFASFPVSRSAKMASIARQIFPGFFFPQSWASSTIQQHGITGSTMATVCLDHQLFYNPPATADPKPASHGLLVWKGVPSTPIFRAPLHPPLPQDPHSPHHGGTGRSRDDALLILSDDDPDDSRSDAEVESGSMAGTGMFLNFQFPWWSVTLTRRSRQGCRRSSRCQLR